MDLTRKQLVLSRLELMINSTSPALAPPAGSGDPAVRHERFQQLFQQVSAAADNDPSIEAVASEIGLS